MYIYSFFNYIDVVEDRLSDKKSQLKKRFNRTDNFINLTLLGVQECMENMEIEKDSSIYLASRNGNMNTTIKVLDAIFLQNRLPMPFNFLNTVNASTLFFIARNFNIEGKTLFVDRFETALPQAFVDVKNGKTVLLGVVEEAIEDLTLHKKRFKSKNIKEKSQWLLLSSKIEDKEPIAKIHDIKLNFKKEEINNIDELFSFLDSSRGVFSFKGRNLSFKVKI